MKILVSNPSFQYSLHTVQALQHLGHEVYFATTYWFNKNRLIEKLIKIFSYTLYSKLEKKNDASISESIVLTKWFAQIHLLKSRLVFRSVEQQSFSEDRFHDNWVSKWVSKNKPDIIIGYEKSCLISFYQAKKYNGICYLDLAQVHPSFIQDLRNKYNFFHALTGSTKQFNIISQIKEKEYKLADRILCLSEFTKKTLIDNKVEFDKIFVNPLGFNPSIFFPKIESEEKINKPLRFIYAGIITKRKGVHQLLEIFSELNSENIELLLIGPEGDASYLLDKYSSINSIRYIGSVAQVELANYFRSADVFVFPSYLDSWAAVIPEAMACGLPVITTHSTGAAQILNKENGFVIEAGNSIQLKSAMQFFISNPQAAVYMGLAAAKTSNTYTWEYYRDRLQNILSSN